MSVYTVIFAFTIAMPSVHGPLADGARSILKPDSLLDLSCHTSLIEFVDKAVAVRPAGAAGTVGLPPAHRFVVIKKAIRPCATNLYAALIDFGIEPPLR